MKKVNFDYKGTNPRASRIYRAIIGAFPGCRSRAQWLICLSTAAKITDAEAAEIVSRYSSASGVWGMLPETEQIAAVERIARNLPKMAQKLAMRRTVAAIRADIDNGGDGNSVRGKFPAYVRWMLDKRGNVTASAVEQITADAFCYLPATLARADETGSSYIKAIINALDRAANAEYSFRNPGRLSKSGGVGASLDALNESGERAKLGTDGDRAVSRVTENSVLNRIRVSEALNSADGEILRLYAMGYKSAEMERITGIPAATIRQRISRFQRRDGAEA